MDTARRIINVIVVLLSFVLFSNASASTQSVEPLKSPLTVASGGSVDIAVNYSTHDINISAMGLGLRFHFDSSKLTYNRMTGNLETNLIGGPQLQDDTDDYDSDPATDKFLLVFWADHQEGQWLGQNQPVTLYTAHFTAASGFSGSTNVRFTASAVSGDFEFNAIHGSILILSADADSDEDGMPDVWEVDHNLDPEDASDASLDDDNDGLTNLEEHSLGTDPAALDSDNDGVDDNQDLFPTDHLKWANSVSGRVLDENGAGLPRVRVDVHDRMLTQIFSANTDENGYYTVNVEPGKYVAVVQSGAEGSAYQTTWYKQNTGEHGATLLDLTTTSQENINFLMLSGTTISGTITGGVSGNVFVSVWSERTHAGSGKEVSLEEDGSTDFVIRGLQEAEDYRLEWHSDTYMNGYYSSVKAGPVGWSEATLLSTTNGSISGADISLGSGKTFALTVTGMQPGEEVRAGLWSDTLDRGGWADANVDASTGVATLVISGLDPTGMDYRLFVDSPVGTYKKGFFKGTPVTTTDSDLSDADDTMTDAGSLVSWSRATLISMADNVSIKVTMDTGGSISGSVTGLASGQEAWVEAFSKRTHGRAGAEVEGNADGTPVTYTLSGLKRAKDYRVSIDGDEVNGGFYSGGSTLTHWENAARVDIGTENATGIGLTVSEGVSISGSLSGLQTGEWAWVAAWSDSTFSRAGVIVRSDTGNDGASVPYKLSGLASASDYEISVDAEGYVQQRKENVSAMSSITDIDFTISTGGKISGSISGLSVSDFVWVDVFSPKTGAWGGGSAIADSSGTATYTVDGLSAASDYVVALQTKGSTLFYKTDGITPVWSQHSGVTVAFGTTWGIDFDLSSAVSMVFNLSGFVTLNPANDDQVVEIMAWSEDGAGAQIVKVGGGSFTLKGLPSSTYMVEVFSAGYIPQRIKTATVSSGAIDSSSLAWTNGWSDMGTVTVAANTTGLDVTLSTGFNLSGTVKDSSGTALSGVWVNAWNGTSAIGSGAVTDSSGAYLIEGLPATTEAEVYTVEVWTSSGTVSKSQALMADTTLDLDMAARESGGVSGSVINSSKVAKAGALVLVYDSAGAQVASTATDSSGAFKVDGLKPGTYTVKVFGDADLSTTYDYNSTSVEVSGSVNALETPLELTAPSGS